LLLPLFLALTGMRTRLDLLNGASAWMWTAVLLVVAVAGKMGGAVIGGRWTGLPWRESLALGALLNPRGLVELIVLNIALQRTRVLACAVHHAGDYGAAHYNDDDTYAESA